MGVIVCVKGVRGVDRAMKTGSVSVLMEVV